MLERYGTWEVRHPFRARRARARARHAAENAGSTLRGGASPDVGADPGSQPGSPASAATPVLVRATDEWLRVVVPVATIRKPLCPNEVKMSLPVGTEEVFVRKDVLEEMLNQFTQQLLRESLHYE